MKKRNILKWIIFSIAIAINLFIIGNSFVSGDASTIESNAVTNTTANIINGITPGSISHDNFQDLVVVVRKLFGHFGLFGFSGVVTTWALYLFTKDHKLNYFAWFGLISLGLGFAVAGISELVQLFMPGRSCSWNDIGIDTLGYFIGDLLVIFVLFLIKKPIFHYPKKEEKQAD